MTEQQAAQALAQNANQIASTQNAIKQHQDNLAKLQANQAKHLADYLAAAGPADREYVFGSYLITIKGGVVSIAPIPPGGIVISPVSPTK